MGRAIAPPDRNALAPAPLSGRCAAGCCRSCRLPRREEGALARRQRPHAAEMHARGGRARRSSRHAAAARACLTVVPAELSPSGGLSRARGSPSACRGRHRRCWSPRSREAPHVSRAWRGAPRGDSFRAGPDARLRPVVTAKAKPFRGLPCDERSTKFWGRRQRLSWGRGYGGCLRRHPRGRRFTPAVIGVSSRGCSGFRRHQQVCEVSRPDVPSSSIRYGAWG